jgi:hypothetical protein
MWEVETKLEKGEQRGEKRGNNRKKVYLPHCKEPNE